MKLFRLADIYLELRPEAKQPRSCNVNGIDLFINSKGVWNQQTRFLLQAQCSLVQIPGLTLDNKILIPEEPRIRTEEVIRTMANLLSVAYHCPIMLSSPYPWVSLSAESQEERTWLANATYFHGDYHSYASPRHASVASIDYLTALQDRDEGAAMLAEAISNDHPTAKFREFMRLFERAFALPASQFEKKLSQFLQGSGLGYDRPEVKSWVEMRDPATHANDLSRNFLILNSHILPVMHRMEQAAYDVLLNKKSWATSSREKGLLEADCRRTWRWSIHEADKGRGRSIQVPPSRPLWRIQPRRINPPRSPARLLGKMATGASANQTPLEVIEGPTKEAGLRKPD